MSGSLRLRTVGLAAALMATLSQTTEAVVAPKGAEAPFVTAGDAPRRHRTVAWSRASQLAAVGLPGWTAMWDRDTDVPLRMWGPGIAAPGAMRDPAIAEAAARAFLTSYLHVLAPGASPADFVVVANELGGAGDVRSVGFEQRAGGVPVLGGAIGVSFKHDRLIMVGSTALPRVAFRATPAPLDAQRLTQAAIGWLRTDGHTVRVTAASRERAIVPIVRPRGPRGLDITYRLAERVAVEAVDGVGAWDVWLDASDASPVARQTKIHYASGRVLFDVPDRSPSGARGPKPAPDALHTVNGFTAISTLDGTVTWTSGTTATVSPGLAGPLVAVTNDAGELATDSLALDDGGEVVWSRATQELEDAQLSAFVFASTAKRFAKTRLNPSLEWLDGTLEVFVNENSTCNAYSTGDDIHFFRARISTFPGGVSCQNTARLADVVYHELGHSLHRNSIIRGVGAFDGALSEGMSDMLSAFITKDHGMGRGFFFSDAPLRDLDPPTDKRWPEDTTGEVHDDGEIIGGAMWDLRKALVAKHGEALGDEIGLRIYYGILQRATDIPSSYAEALVSDDDDGDLTNGTPNICEIDAAFGAHGLADPHIRLGLGHPVRDGMKISISTSPTPSTARCDGVEVSSVVVGWKIRGGEETLQMAEASGTTYTGTIPEQPDGTVVQYRVRVALSDGSMIDFPNNPADPFYELYVGEVTPLWCADFESGATGWVTGSAPEDRVDWEVGMPRGLAGDPKTAFGGTNVFGTDLARDGAYRRNSLQWAETPEIDVSGHTEVRLQYQRWLGVEDGFFDKARVYANGTEIWTQYRSPSEPERPVHHVDKEWRFQDLDVSSHIVDGKLKVKFELASDGGFSLAGWNLDDVCIVVPGPPPACQDSQCGEEREELCAAGGSAVGLLPLLGALGLLLRRRRR